MRRVPHTLLLIAIASASGAEKLRLEKTDPVGRKIENEFYIADLSHRVMNGKEEDSGTLRGLTYKPFGVTFFRNPPNGRMHKGISLQRAGTPGYKDIGTWTPIQTFREEQKGGFYIHHREGYFADYPEVKLEVEYRPVTNLKNFPPTSCSVPQQTSRSPSFSIGRKKSRASLASAPLPQLLLNNR